MNITPESDIPVDLPYIQTAALSELIAKADAVRRFYHDDRMDLCSIVNAKSGRCSEDCRFCAQSAAHHTQTPVYPLMAAEEIVQAAIQAQANGAERFGIVTSGNRLQPAELDAICAAIRSIRERTALQVCCSLGALPPSALRRLWQAGARRYHHNVETSPGFYPRIVSTHNFSERLATIRAAQSEGFAVCSGGIIGLGESWQDRWDMAMVLRELAVESVPLNFLIPIPGTALGESPPLAAEEAIRTICLFRLLLPQQVIKIAAGRERCLKDFQAMGFLAGANGMLIGGYLTVRGRTVDEDRQLTQEVRSMWKK